MKIIELIKSGEIAEGVVMECSIDKIEKKYIVHNYGELIRYESFKKEPNLPSVIKVYDNINEEYREYGNFQYIGESDNSNSISTEKVYIYEWTLKLS